ncbi:SWI/SNF complex subunit SWI3D isoform X2 [Euphorbia lathyris]|uniref:SWI/SNF complex subunit SWI3D isoform X2 n=1 Tax=Euphorbia lathyris TaxID=212925 RepID=UPI0033141190
MEDKPAGSVAAVSAESPASAEPASSRRRAGGQKRKANALSTSGASSTPSKRLTREKAAISHSPIHNGGPLTRARQSPNNFASSASSAATGFKLQEKLVSAPPETATVKAAREELIRLEELKASIDADFEVIRSREPNAHVVPNHCGWFSWTKIHPLEERTLPSFFNGKSQIRTPDTYMEIRNWIVKKFHKNPDVQIELKDVSELEVADVDARQEVLEFLDYWGLINFHPFPQIDSTACIDDHGVAEKELLLEKLFRFENIQPSTPVVSKPNLSTPVISSRLFPESSTAEESVRPEGPSVEYHCNSCSADCSRKRYHCQKQADYDLCANCFSNRKFASNMSSSDFILMEPAEAPGLSGGKWTDQETLLLLEALELYRENWNEIAEHVATKTKAQCILHFVQMPIEDGFFDEDGDLVAPSRETTDLPAVTDDSLVVPRDGTETSEDKAAAKEDQPHTSPVEAPKPEDASDGHQESVKPDSAREAIIDEEKLKKDSEVKAAQEASEKFALKALTEAFDGVGYLPTPENKRSFAEVGNPVMALAAFLGNLVGSDVAAASAFSSLKSVNSDSPGVQLATRHCFLLEDPPDDQKEPAGLDGTIEMAQDALKDNQDSQTQKGDDSTSVLEGGDVSKDHCNKKDENSTPEKKEQPDSSNDDVIEKVNTANEAGQPVTTEEVKPGKLNESIEPELQKDPESRTSKESNEKSSQSECAPSSVRSEGSSKAIHSQPTDVSKDVDMVSDSISSQNIEACQSVASVSVEEPSQAAKASKDAVDMVSNPLPAEKNEELQPDHSQPTEAKNDVDMMSPQPSESKEPQQPVAPDLVIENGATKAEGLKDDKNEKSDCKNLKDDHPIDKVKRAAVSALSAAAVKAKVLANQEEDQIRQLAASLIEKQLYKLEMKVSFFNEMDHLIMRVREQLDRSRQKLYHERAQIIAARLGLPPSSSRPMPPALPTNRVAPSLANAIPRPPMSVPSQRPPVSKPMGTIPPTPSNPFVSTATAGNPVGPSGQEAK